MATETDPVLGSRKPGLWVTGATGFIGSRFLDNETRDRYRVIAHARSPERVESLKDLPPADVWSFGDLHAGIIDWPASENIETTLHLASPSSWYLLNDPKVYDIVIDSVKHVWRHTLENGGKHFVFVSSASALGGYDSRADWKSKRNHQLP
ncbi:MAG: NAD(P)-dependent oxidoreductase, partial [Verrucomicrobiota bacterium]